LAVVRATSQPFSGLLSQSNRDGWQVMRHTPLSQVGAFAVFESVEQAWLHAPQFCTSAATWTGHPSFGVEPHAQFRYPAWQAKLHCPPAQLTATFEPACAVQSFPHAPQFLGSSCDTQVPPQQIAPAPHADPAPHAQIPSTQALAFAPHGVHATPHALTSVDGEPAQVDG
jgi:hypothetical protein